MRVYSSFLIRCWLTDDASQDKQSLLKAEHIQTGTSMRAASLSELEPWLFAACRSAPAKNEKAMPEHGENQDRSYNCEDIHSER